MKMPILAHTPIFNELDKFKSQGIEKSFVYGDRDWIDTWMGGPPVSEMLRERGEKVYIIEDSDHHIYLDNSDQLLEILDEILDTE